QVHHDVLDGHPGRVAHAVDQVAPQPARARLRVGRDDDDVGPVMVEGVHRGVERIGVHDLPVRLDADLAQLRERGRETVLRGVADRLVVHDVAGLRLVLRAHHRHVEGAGLLVRLLGVLAHRVDQRPAPDGLVGDHQDAQRLLGHSLVPACSAAPAGVLNTPCTAPGIPYSYGPPTTVGTSSKLNTG